MPRIKTGNIRINYVEHGTGDDVLLAIHGCLGCADWLSLVLPLVSSGIRIIAAECRGCGDSDKPEAADNYSNYSMATHAADMLALLDALDIGRCHLYGHSTGGIICSHMLVAQPARFGKVLMLDPVTPFGLELGKDQICTLAQMKADHDAALVGLATAMPTLFRSQRFVFADELQFAEATSPAQRRLFRRLVDMTRVLSDGIWFGTPHDLARERKTQRLAQRIKEMTHEHLLLYGKLDYWSPFEHVQRMAERLPNAKLEIFPHIGHSMCIENPLLLAHIFADFFITDDTVTSEAAA
ncbi:MAG TPA: alpha/beta hydrolase [Casimicrobiaceae bacterium]|nr:alpha/beta hydrolase [Casimicrobiaceae bacterium]